MCYLHIVILQKSCFNNDNTKLAFFQDKFKGPGSSLIIVLKDLLKTSYFDKVRELKRLLTLFLYPGNNVRLLIVRYLQQIQTSR